jgi:hypothetical protein
VTSNVKDLGKLVFSVVSLAAFLPVMLWLVISKDKYTVMTQASQKKEIRVWLEPAEVVMAPGQTYTFRVVSQISDENTLIPKMELKLLADQGLMLMDDKINYSTPFGGKTEVGKVDVVAKSKGKFLISVDEKSVVTGLPDMPVTAAVASIIVQ